MTPPLLISFVTTSADGTIIRSSITHYELGDFIKKGFLRYGANNFAIISVTPIDADTYTKLLALEMEVFH